MTEWNTTWRRRWRWRFWAIFLGLLALSHLVRWERPPHGLVRPGQQRVEVPIVDDTGNPTGNTTPMYYLDLRPAQAPDAPVLVLLHGSPIASRGLEGLMRELAPRFRLIVPDLPGFGASAGPELPSYSTEAHATELLSLLDQLHVPHANIAGYSMGGGVAMEFAALAPTRTQSLILINSIGPVEYEWLGDPVLNHALYGAQLAVITAVQELFPHFGLMDIMPLNEAYARSFWDTDQRRVRDILEDYRGPMLIVHAQNDFYEPLAGAQETYRIVPQSELDVLPGGHLLIYRHPNLIAPLIIKFVNKVEDGTAQIKEDADANRMNDSLVGEPPPGKAGGAYEAMILTLLILATLLAEDMTCIAAGLLVARGVLGFWTATIACFTGIYIGDLLLYLAGWQLGRPMLKYAPFRWWINENDLRRMGEAFEKRGGRLVFISRFIPASRLPLFIGAGILRFSFVRMSVALALAGMIWTPPFIGLAAVLGQQMLALVERYERDAFYVLVLLVLSLFAFVHVVLPLFTWRGRRLSLSRWRRLTRWEFWPWWLVYSPILAHCLWLAVRRRGVAVFTCANPALPAGGFVGESKSLILRGLAGAGEAVAAWTLLPAADLSAAAARIQLLDTWMTARGRPWPVVLKPDVGERGQGVAVCRDHEQARRYLAANPAAIIAQEHVPGVEYGVFYYRFPDQAQGHILSITDKRFPTVTGDGRRTLERLILADDRAVCSARFFLAKFAERLDEVPPAGAVVPLVELGTHSRGALFLDGTAALATPELRAAVDAISHAFAGFYFGRYDLRCPSVEDFRAGKNLRVIELNGVTSEATAIYDPRHTLFKAWRMLDQQWRLCFAIGAANRARGAPPTPVRELVRTFLHSRSTAKFEA